MKGILCLFLLLCFSCNEKSELEKEKKIESEYSVKSEDLSISFGEDFSRHENKEVICYTYHYINVGVAMQCKFKESK